MSWLALTDVQHRAMVGNVNRAVEVGVARLRTAQAIAIMNSGDLALIPDVRCVHCGAILPRHYPPCGATK